MNIRGRVAYWCLQVSRASSRLLNAIWGGEGDSTFSAWSYYMTVRRDKGPFYHFIGRCRTAVTDWLVRASGHCKDSYDWHVAHDLLRKD
jgi:hypothetical protein